MKPEKTQPFNMRLPISVMENIKKEAIEKGICYTAVAKMILKEYFNEKENNKKDICA